MALTEEYFYDERGVLRNNSLLEYRMPTALDLPMIDTVIVEVPNPEHPFGVRGVGETPIVPPPATVANAIHAATGALSSIGAVAAGTRPVSVAVDASGKFAYVANGGSDNVSAYTINAATGALTNVGAFAAGTLPLSVTVDPSGKFAYVANTQSANVSAYTINASTGALSEVRGSPFDAGAGPFSVTTTRRIQ